MAGCTYSYVLMPPQIANPGGAHLLLGMNPKFTSAATDDYHLIEGSPAIDAADPAAQNSHDFDGVSRPNGTAADIGAFELH